MPCHGCGESFGFLKKELGCPKCGFSFCKKCLRFKLIDEDSKKTLSVCHGCCTKSVDSSNIDEGNNKAKIEKSVGIMKAFHKLQSLENPDRPPIVLYREDTHSSRLGRLKKGLSVEDQKIVERLEGLRQTDIPNRRKSDNPEQEVALRLAKLRGEEYPTSSANTLPNKPPETEADLISRLSSEVNLDEKHNVSMVADIEDRLARLRGPNNTIKSSETQASGTDTQHEMETGMENLSEEEQIQRIIEQFTQEIGLESKPNTTSAREDGNLVLENTGSPEAVDMVSDEDDDDDDVDVDLLCRICDEKRATLMCKECDNDIFCKACFFEFHKEIGEVHKSKNV